MGRLETEILLSPVWTGTTAGAFVGLAALVFFAMPPAGATTAAVAAFDFVAALRTGRRPARPPRRLPAGRSFMMASSDWSSFPDMVMDLVLVLVKVLIVEVCGVVLTEDW